ncbi:MAG: glyoxylase family protein [Gaiellaceae bacterium]|nr:glyoxylase family protein [Gaiellaceae bacterium]
MRILGLVFAGTATDRRPEMATFARDVLGLEALDVAGAGADMFALPDGSTFAVAGPRELGETSRSLGFLVADLDEAIAELSVAGVEVDEVATNERFRYVHFRAPDGALYELVQRMGGDGIEPPTSSV